MSEKDARELIEEIVEKAVKDGTDYDPNGLDSIVRRVVDALLTYGPGLGAGWYRAGWLLNYGRVHEVVEAYWENSDGDAARATVYTVQIPEDDE